MIAAPAREELSRRQHRTAKLLDNGLDAVVFFGSSSLRYLCGFTGTDGVLVFSADGVEFLTDSRYTTQAEQQVHAQSIIEYGNKHVGLADCLDRLKVTQVGYEAEAISSAGFGTLAAKIPVKWVALSEELKLLRALKGADEIAAIESATQLSANAFETIVPLLSPGKIERDIALELEITLRRLGAEAKAFDFIVASGERGALPHGVASAKKLGAGELITIDFGCRVDGYHSDETVTVALGSVDDKLRNIYDVVLEAHDRALSRVAPGASLKELDTVARDYIRNAGYGDYFGHGLGHGVGLDVHEAPTVSPRSEVLAEPGMVFTIEPGIYVPGCGGVRIEDMVLVTADGRRVLTQIPKTYRCLSLAD